MADDRLLLETGDALLLESGDALLLDVAPDPLVHVYLGRTHSLSVGTANIPITAGVIATAGFAGYTEVVCPLAGTLRNLVVRLVSAPGGSTTRSVTLYKNGSATALTVAFGSADTEQRDETHDIAVAAGDRLRLFADSSGSPVTTDAFWTLEWESADAVSSWYGATAIGDSGYVDPFTGETSGTADGCLRLIPCDGTITALAGMNTFLTLSGSANGINLYVYKNGVKQNGSSGTIDTKLAITNVAQNTMVSVAFELPVVRGDTVYVGIEEFGTYPASWTTMAMVFEATTFGQSIVASRGAGTPSSSAANYHVIQGQSDGDQVWGGTLASSTVRRYAGTSDFTLRDLILTVTVAPGAAKTRTFELMQTGSVPASPPAGVITNTELEIDDVGHAIVFSDGDIVGPLRSTPSGTPTSTGIEYWSLIMGPASPTPPTPPTPGGEVPAGVNPAAAAVPSGDILRAFFTLRLGATIVGRAEVTLNDDADYHGGPKLGEVLEWGPIARELVPGGEFRPVETRVVVADASRFWRTTADAETIATAYAEIQVLTDTTRYAKAEPYRIFGGRVTAHGGLPGLQYEFQLRDTLSEMLGPSDDPAPMPDNPLTRTLFPGMDEALEGRVIPTLLGHVTDEDAVVPQGSAPVLILGHVNFAEAWGGINKTAVAGVICQGACAGIASAQGYYNDPDTPDVRLAIPESAYGGNPVWMPGKAGWAETGLTGDFADYPLPLSSSTRRYTPFFVDVDHPLAAAFEEGRVLVAFNLPGLGPDPEGGSIYFSDPSRIWQWLITNGRVTPYTTGDYADIPTLDGTISLISTDAVERTRTRQRARLTDGYPVGRLIGRDGNPESFAAVLDDLCLGTDMEQGTDRHGRAMIDTEDATADPVASLSDLHDIETGTFRVYPDRSRFLNRLVHLWGERYVAPSAPRATPAEGAPVPKAIAPYSEWISGYNDVPNAAAITANRDFITRRRLENRWVRTRALAEHLEALWLARAAGPSPSLDGPRVFELTGPLKALLSLELGDNILLDALEGYGATGYAGALGRVMRIEHNLQTRRTTIKGDVLLTDEAT